METATLPTAALTRIMQPQNHHPMCGQQQESGVSSSSEAGNPEDTEKLLFWQLAKKLCSQRRRAERSVVKAYREQQHDEQPIRIPAEIVAGAGSSSAASASARSGAAGSSSTESVWQQQQKDAAWLFAPTTTEDDLVLMDDPLDAFKGGNNKGLLLDEEDNSDAASCVSDVTRELQDIDAPALYPSLDILAEVPDIEVKEHKEGKIEVSSNALYPSLSVLLEEDVPEMGLGGIATPTTTTGTQSPSTREDRSTRGGRYSNWRSRYPKKVQPEEEEFDLSNLMMPSSSSSNKNNAKKEEFDLSNLLMTTPPVTKPAKKSHPTFGTPSSPYSSLIPKDSNSTRQGGAGSKASSKKNKDNMRRQRTSASKGSTVSPDRGNTSLHRGASEGSPRQPQRRLSLDSRRSSNLSISEGDELDGKMDIIRENLMQLRRNISEASPVQPQRRRSIGSLCSKSLLEVASPSKKKHDDDEEEEDLMPWRNIAPTRRSLERHVSTESPMQPRRRGSLDSKQNQDFVIRENDYRSTRTPTWEELSYGGTVDGSRYGGMGARQRPPVARHRHLQKQSYYRAPSLEELGYEDDSRDQKRQARNASGSHNNQSSPRMPSRRASFSSFIDDNSTIATETLGLYRRRKSVDSTVAEPLLSDLWPDNPPAFPQRQMSSTSLMHNSSQSSMSRLTSVDESNLSPYGLAGRAVRGATTRNVISDIIREESGHPSAHGHPSTDVGGDNKRWNPVAARGGSEFPSRNQLSDFSNSINHQAQNHHQEAYYTEQYGSYKRHQNAPGIPLRHNQQRRPMQVEIHPGVFQPLRGSVETLRAIERNSAQKTTCMACTVKLLCVPDAEYVLCPVCKVVSPIATNFGCGGGVGLGIEPSENRYRPGAQA